VICADEKTQIQARRRDSPTTPAAPGRSQRVEHDYDRGGALSYLAAWDVHSGQLTGRCEQQTGIAPFARLVEQVMTTEPYARARRVFWIVDNGSSHRGHVAADRLHAEWPNLVLVHLPFYASWLNQIEIVFSVIQRKVLTPNDFVSLQAVVDRLDDFEHHYNQIAKPFEWALHPPRPQRPHRARVQSRTAAQTCRLIATGLTATTTKQPGSQPATFHRQVAHIHTKLRQPSRAAAAATTPPVRA
jgi:hypothetical protein